MRTIGKGARAPQINATVSLVNDWYEPGDRDPRLAWVVDWVDLDEADPVMHRELVELAGDAAESSDRETELLTRAEEVVAAGRPSTPAGFGFAGTGSETRAALYERIKLTVFAVDAASNRVADAARRTDEFASTALSVALVDAVAWIRALDDVLRDVWGKSLTGSVREQASRATDEHIARLSLLPIELGPAIRKRSTDNQPFADWTCGLIGDGAYLSRCELQGLRWLGGKLLHFGPLPATELRQWRVGAEPRWKWRSADALFPPRTPDQNPGQRAFYESHLAGRDVVGTVMMIDTLIRIEYAFYGLLRHSDEDEGLAWAGT